jgi:hypothetical protein
MMATTYYSITTRFRRIIGYILGYILGCSRLGLGLTFARESHMVLIPLIFDT